jgi:hypothetical protein
MDEIYLNIHEVYYDNGEIRGYGEPVKPYSENIKGLEWEIRMYTMAVKKPILMAWDFPNVITKKQIKLHNKSLSKFDLEKFKFVVENSKIVENTIDSKSSDEILDLPKKKSKIIKESEKLLNSIITEDSLKSKLPKKKSNILKDI